MLFEPVEPFRVGCDFGKEARSGQVGECFVNGLGFACIGRRRASCDLGDFMAPIEQAAPRIVGEVVDTDIQLVVVTLGEVDGFDAQDRPSVVVGSVGENETSSRVALRQGPREVLHDRVVVAVADKHDGG